MAARRDTTVRVLLDRHGRTYADEAGIRLADKPSPLYRLLVLAVLLSARIDAQIAVAAARELSRSGMRTPQRMAAATWQQRVDALGRGRYRRYDERTATMLGDGAEWLQERWRGDLRRLRTEAAGDPARVRSLLQEVKGIGPTGADIFCREAQGVWPEVAPYVDDRASAGARALGLPTSSRAIVSLVDATDLPRLVAALVRASLDPAVVDDVRAAGR
jgi:hypothetical protein